MAKYVESFGSKLDWAMPFQRTGKFPLDRTNIFSSYEDILAYAKQDGSDSRQLGGTSYVGQIVVNYGPGPEVEDGVPGADEVAAYVITAVGSSPAVQKLAQSSSTGDYGQDIAALQTAVGELEADIVEINGKLVVATTSVDGLMAAADKLKLDGVEAGAQVNVIEAIQLNGSPIEIAAKTVNIDLSNYATKQDLTTIPKFAIEVVSTLPTEDISTTTVYLVLQEEGEQSGQDIYDEYIYVNGKWELIGNTDIDLSGYATTEAMNSAIQAAVADMATQTWVTGQLGSYATTAALTSGLAGKADTTTVSGIDGRLTTAEGEIDTLQTDIATKLNQSQVDARIQAATIQASQVSGKVASAAQADNAAKVTNALTVGDKTFDGSEAVEITADDLGALTTIPQASNSAIGGILIGYESAGNNVAVQLDENGKAFVAVPAAPTYTNGAGLALSGNEFSIAEGGVLTSMVGDAQITDAKIASMNATKLTLEEDDELILDGGVSNT